MKENGTILVCVLPDLKPDPLKRYLSNAALFAKWIDADIQFLTPAANQSDLDSALQAIMAHELKTVRMVSHSIVGSWVPEVISEAVKRCSCDLIVVPSGGITDDSTILERTDTPVLVLSPEVNFAQTKINSVLIPMSGEIRISSALKFGLQLATGIHVPVDLVHVAKKDGQVESPLENMGDQVHHEYRELLDKLLSEASPFSNMRERAHVRTLYQVRGVPADEILETAKRTPACALVAEWHGSLIEGRARTLKELLDHLPIPTFLVKAESEQKCVLKVGPEEQAA